MLPTVKPVLDPLAQRAAIDALEAQRAAYRRFARTVGEQTRAVGSGDGDRAQAAAEATSRGFDELEAGARALGSHLDRVREQGSPEQQAEIQQRLDTLAHDAAAAQTAIQNLTAQLDAWRSAYARQLSGVGLTPGSATPNEGGTADAAPGVGSARLAAPRGYGPRGHARSSRSIPSLLDRKG